jgi:hypothetical protein
MFKDFFLFLFFFLKSRNPIRGRMTDTDGSWETHRHPDGIGGSKTPSVNSDVLNRDPTQPVETGRRCVQTFKTNTFGTGTTLPLPPTLSPGSHPSLQYPPVLSPQLHPFAPPSSHYPQPRCIEVVMCFQIILIFSIQHTKFTRPKMWVSI